MSYKNGKVLLVAQVDPVIRDYARAAAREKGVELSHWVERVVREAFAKESIERALDRE